MKLMHDPVRKFVAEIIIEAARPLGLALELTDAYDSLVEPPNPEMGDLAFGCFTLARQLKKAPPQIANDLQLQIKSFDFSEVILRSKMQVSPVRLVEAQTAGPYLNFKMSSELLGNLLLNPILDESAFERKLSEQNPKTMIEFSQPNTHKEIHVGHMRNLCLGDALVRIMKYAGNDIISATFPGDVGTHVAKCLWYIKYHQLAEFEKLRKSAISNAEKGEWLGRMYSRGHLKLEDDLGTPQELKNREQLTEILKQLESKEGNFFDLWKETREWSVDLMKKVYDWSKVSFDHWYWESDVDTDSVRWVKKLFEEKKLVLSEGAIGMDLNDVNLGFCLLLKKDGTGLYATKDIELARRKFQDHRIQKSIYVVDQRQSLHFQQVFAVLDRLGFEQAKNCYHLQYNFVELPDGAMSSRKGNIVPLTELVQKMESMVKDLYLSRYRGEWAESEIDLVAEQVAQGAIKYGMLKMDNNKKIVFDMSEWLKLEGDSGPFVQYSYARISSLLKKLNYDKMKKNINWSILTENSERKLIQKLMHFNTVSLSSAETQRPSILCSFVFDTAKAFNLFYHECPIGAAGSEELALARLNLAAATGKVLKKGLALLGIPVPNRM